MIIRKVVNYKIIVILSIILISLGFGIKFNFGKYISTGHIVDLISGMFTIFSFLFILSRLCVFSEHQIDVKREMEQIKLKRRCFFYVKTKTILIKNAKLDKSKDRFINNINDDWGRAKFVGFQRVVRLMLGLNSGYHLIDSSLKKRILNDIPSDSIIEIERLLGTSKH